MKVVYRTCIENYLNDQLIDYCCAPNWHYGELPETSIWKDFKTFEEFYNEYGYENKTIFKREPYVALHAICEDAFCGKVKKADFKSYKVTNRYKEVTYKYTMEDLIKKLDAEDFINYCKDNGLNACPMV